MRREDHTLDVPQAAAGAGNAQGCAHYVDKWVEVSGSFVGTVAVEGRLAPAGAWTAVTSVAAPAIVEVLPLFHEVRVNVTAYVSGQPAAHLAALDRRSDA